MLSYTPSNEIKWILARTTAEVWLFSSLIYKGRKSQESVNNQAESGIYLPDSPGQSRWGITLPLLGFGCVFIALSFTPESTKWVTPLKSLDLDADYLGRGTEQEK